MLFVTYVYLHPLPSPHPSERSKKPYRELNPNPEGMYPSEHLNPE